jgi:hypothetical protein
MIEQDVPLQIDLFTGAKVDTRTRDQKARDRERHIPRQLLMFTQRDIAQTDVNPHPRMDVSPGRLRLIAEDPRTEEEIEQDLLRQAQAMTPDLFEGSLSVMPTPTPTPETQPNIQSTALVAVEPSVAASLPDEDTDTETTMPSAPPLTKWAAYLALVTAAQERAATVSTTPVSALSESISMNLAKLDARHAGLTGDEIAAALTIGAYCGRTTPTSLPADRQPSQAPTLSKELPILWTTKADMLKRRPDLASQLEQLGDYEVEALAALVGQALQEFYWMQLNVVLSLYLDHDLHLTRIVRKQPKSDILAP